jgi:hypothetical protein
MTIKGTHLLGDVAPRASAAGRRDQPAPVSAGPGSSAGATLTATPGLVNLRLHPGPGGGETEPLAHLYEETPGRMVELGEGAANVRQPLRRGTHEECVLSPYDRPIGTGKGRE